MVPRRGLRGHVIYDAAVRQVVSVCLGALACVLVIVVSHAHAQELPPVDPEPTTTTAPTQPTTTSTTQATPATTATTATTQKPPPTTTTTSTTQPKPGAPVPPPAAGPSQTLVPDLLGGALELQTTTTSPLTPAAGLTESSVVSQGRAATATIASSNDSPSGATLALAAVAWLASLGGVLVFAEERRAAHWKHLAR